MQFSKFFFDNEQNCVCYISWFTFQINSRTSALYTVHLVSQTDPFSSLRQYSYDFCGFSGSLHKITPQFEVYLSSQDADGKWILPSMFAAALTHFHFIFPPSFCKLKCSLCNLDMFTSNCNCTTSLCEEKSVTITFTGKKESRGNKAEMTSCSWSVDTY